jgi:hypothetical protein
MNASTGQCTCDVCQTLRTHGWRAQPQTTFIVGMLLGLGCTLLGLMVTLLMIGWLP